MSLEQGPSHSATCCKLGSKSLPSATRQENTKGLMRSDQGPSRW